MIRQVLLAVGTVATAAGVGLLVAPGAGREFGLVPLVVSGLAVAIGGATVVVGRLSTAREPRDPPVDREDGVEVPGAAFDRRLASVPGHSARGADQREAVRERLRPLVVGHLVRERGLAPETARERLDDGTWTDDPVAAALFTGQSPSLRSQVRSLAGGRSAFQRRVERVVAVLGETDDE